MNLRSLYNPIGRKKKRYKKILQLLEINEADRILNLGSGKGYTFEEFNKKNPIIGMDIFSAEENEIKQKNFQYIQRTDDKLPFKDNDFDAVVSIGVLEHIQPESSFYKTCTEIQRVGKSYVIIVPSFMTLIEPHYSFPFFQHFSENIQKKLNTFFRLKYAEEGQDGGNFEKIRYLKKRDWQKLFPDSRIQTHMHIGPFITNYIIWKNHKG
jgi:ubiquinone/menaquinone biosynthesis C-methylase UbiE